MRASGLWWIDPEENKPLRLSSSFDVLGLARDPNGLSWATAIEWLDADNMRHLAFVPHSDLVGDSTECLRPLASAGLHVTPGRKQVALFKRALFALESSNRVRLVKHSGWFGSAFVLPNVTIGDNGDEKVAFVGNVDAARFARSGSMEDWIGEVAAPAAGNSRLIFAISIAFAGPILDLLQTEGIGVHYFGPSSCGKSTVLIINGSVWGGGGRAGFTQTWRATGNGLESIARAHSGTVLPLDEISELDPREAGAATYMLINGQGKARATKEAELRARSEWRVMLLSVGETRLTDKIAESGRKPKAGQLIRVVDIPADAGCGRGIFEETKGDPPAMFAKRVKEAALKYYGVAGPQFVSVLAENTAGVAEAARAMIAETVRTLLADEPEQDGQSHRVAERFALIATAGEMARVALGLPWDEGEVVRAAKACFTAWRGTRGGDGSGEFLAAREAIRGAIERHGEARFRNLEQPELNTTPIRDLLGYRLRRDNTLLFALTATGWSETLSGVADPASAAKMLHERGILFCGRDRSHRHFLKLEGRTVPTYAVRASALFDMEIQGAG